MEIKEILLSLLRSEIVGEAAGEDVIASLDAERALAVLRVAKSHDLAHIIAAAFSRVDLFSRLQSGADAAQLKKTCEHFEMAALYRYENLRYALEEIGRVLTEAQIPFTPLKGAVMRGYYPTPWHRSSCDIDVLVHEEDLERACGALAAKAGYRVEGKKNFHDIHLYSSAGVHLELHFCLLSSNEKYDLLLSRAWEYSRQNANNSFLYEQTDAYFLFHHVAHMAYHFKSGGCGIKPFLDLFVLSRYASPDIEGARELLSLVGLDTFFASALSLAEVWFMGGEHTDVTRRMEVYLLMGGVYGTVDNKVLVQQKEKGGRLGYALSRIFLARSSLSRLYPILDKHPWMMPVMQVRRWVRLVFTGGMKRGAHELKVNGEITAAEAQAADQFLTQLGL